MHRCGSFINRFNIFGIVSLKSAYGQAAYLLLMLLAGALVGFRWE